MKKIYTEIYLKAFILIAIFSGAVFAQNTSNVFASEQWQLIEINGKKLNGSKAFVEFNEKELQITGNAGCNRMFGKYERNGTSIKFSGIGTTKKFCAEKGLMKTEADFTDALGETTGFALKSKTLSFLARNRLVLKFNKMEKENSAGNSPIRLEDKKWILEAIGNAPIAKVKEPAFLVFDTAKKSAGGNTGCNVFGGNYSASGEKISFTEIISTMRACVEDEKMKNEREFLDGLQAANNYSVKNGKLYLYQGENLLLTFFAAAR